MMAPYIMLFACSVYTQKSCLDVATTTTNKTKQQQKNSNQGTTEMDERALE